MWLSSDHGRTISLEGVRLAESFSESSPDTSVGLKCSASPHVALAYAIANSGCWGCVTSCLTGNNMSGSPTGVKTAPAAVG